MATGEEHVAASAVEDTSEKKQASTTELPAPSGVTKKGRTQGCICSQWECESLGLEDFPTSERLRWHGHQPGKPDWSEASRFVAFTMKDETKGEIYVAFNTSHLLVVVGLPECSGFRWEPVVDTGKEAPYDFLTDGLPDRAVTVYQFSHFLNSNLYPMLSYSSIIIVLRPDV
ncbi:Isoamylase 1 chloroplastic [Zea mays]|uniref:Isoamylase 1 chloroplastic n=1 Tax=Zea mays TaxID=4577 RepID=A0A1D6QKD6_MAIZE|nr:Isoamylase 1 chloroplastic [Zea mays]